LKQDYQLKITLHFLLASLAEQENNDQNTVLTCKRIGGGENLEFMSYIPFSKFITFYEVIFIKCKLQKITTNFPFIKF